MNRGLLIPKGIFVAAALELSASAGATDFWAGAGGDLSKGTTPAVGGGIEVGAQDSWVGCSAELHAEYLTATGRKAYAGFLNARLQLPWFAVRPYAMAGIGLTNEVPMFTASAAPVWKIGGGLRFSPLPALFVDVQGGVVTLANKYAHVGVGLSL